MCFAIKYRHPSKKKKCSVTYTNASSCLFTAPFCTSKLQISSPGLYMLLKHVHGLAGVNTFHSSPPGTVFFICAETVLAQHPSFGCCWTVLAQCQGISPCSPCLHHPSPTSTRIWGGQGTGRGHRRDRCPEQAKGRFHNIEQRSAIKAAVLGAERGGGGWLHCGCCSGIVWGSVCFWEQLIDSQFVTCFPPPPFLHLVHCLSWSTKFFQFLTQITEQGELEWWLFCKGTFCDF